jgi:uncharacterized membrane protein YagU involved in acid resistance
MAKNIRKVQIRKEERPLMFYRWATPRLKTFIYHNIIFSLAFEIFYLQLFKLFPFIQSWSSGFSGYPFIKIIFFISKITIIYAKENYHNGRWR